MAVFAFLGMWLGVLDVPGSYRAVWAAVGRGLACVQNRADTAEILGSRYLIENEFICNVKLTNYFKFRGVRYYRYRVRPWVQLDQQKRAVDLCEQLVR
ncbi:MAG: hypothetical protein ACKOBQ_01735 [Bacteroidota bacterium]